MTAARSEIDMARTISNRKSAQRRQIEINMQDINIPAALKSAKFVGGKEGATIEGTGESDAK